MRGELVPAPFRGRLVGPDLALALGAVSAEDAEAIQGLALRLKRMLRALLGRNAG